MNKRLVYTVIAIAIVAGLSIGYIRGLPNDFVDESEIIGGVVTDYGYRCGDGSEFTLIPSENVDTIRIVPATSADYVKESVLKAMSDATGMYFEGDGIALRPSASGLVLVSAGHATTTCSSMRPADESLFNLGA